MHILNRPVVWRPQMQNKDKSKCKPKGFDLNQLNDHMNNLKNLVSSIQIQKQRIKTEQVSKITRFSHLHDLRHWEEQ